MKKYKDYGGAKATCIEDYDLRREGLCKKYRADNPWWATRKSNLILLPIFSAMDGMVLFTLFDSAYTQSVYMGIVMSFGIAVVLNVLPLLIAKFAHQTSYRVKKHAGVMLVLCILSFLLIYTGTFMLRFAYSEEYEPSAETIQLENMVSNSETVLETSEVVEEIEVTDKGYAMVLLLSLSPFVTSVLGFSIAFISEDEVRTRLQFHEIRDVELDEAISDLEAAVDIIESVVDKNLMLDAEMRNVSIEEVDAKREVMKSMARLYLAEYLQSPEATSRLSSQKIEIDGELEDTVSICKADNQVA